MSATQFVCYSPQPAAHLEPRAFVVRQILHDAKGFFRTRGLSQQLIRQSVGRLPLRVRVAAFGDHYPTLGVIHRSLLRLERAGLARQVTAGQWVEARRG